MVFPKQNFVTATPESQGVSSAALLQALQAIRASGKDIHSMLVVKNGCLISETYFAPYHAETSHSMYSCSKTFTSMLIGIAQGKGLLHLSDTVASFFPEKLPENPSENLLKMTVRDLLHMATGNDQDTFDYMTQSKEDWVKVFLSRPVEHAPGTFFRYNTGATYMLSAILTSQTGKTALQLAREWIFDKIGIRFVQWDASPQGISMGGTGLHLTPRQMARFGLLLLNEGRWEDEQIIPREYVLEAQQKQIDTSNHIDHPDWCAGYCYQMWRCSFDAYRADGMGGQFIVVLPKENAVVIFTSALAADIVYPMDLLRETLLPALQGQALLSEDEVTNRTLVEYSAACENPVSIVLPDEAKAKVPWGRRILHTQPQADGIGAFTIYDGRIRVEMGMGPMDFGYKWNAPQIAHMALPLPFLRSPHPARVWFQAQWKHEEEAMFLRMGALGEPWTMDMLMHFGPDGVQIDMHSTFAGDKTISATYL